MGYTKNTLAGFSSQSIFIFTATALSALKLIVLARILTPHDFGIFSLVVIALGVTEAITQTGINVTIIQSKESINYFINTAWVVAIFRGFVIAILVSILGVLMSWMYSEPQLSFWVSLAAVTPIIKGFINPAIVGFHKNLQFFRDSAYRISLIVVETAVTIGAALVTHSVNSFVIGMVVAALFEVVISFLFFRTRPRFEYNPVRARQIFANAKGLSIGALLSYLNDNIDNFLVGKILGVSTLGLYQNCYSLTHKPTFGLAQALSHSTLPIYSKLEASADRLRRAYYRSMFGLLLLLVIVSLPFFFAGRMIVEVLLGENWLPIVGAIPWLAAAGILHGLANQSYTVLIAKQQYVAMNFHRAIVVVSFICILFLAGKNYGLEGAAAAVFFARLLSLPFIAHSMWRILKS